MTRIHIAIGLLVVATGSGIASAGSDDSDDSKRTRANDNRCYSVRVAPVSKDQKPATARRRSRGPFVAHDILDLELSVWLSAKSEASLVEIHVYTPTGRLYDVLQATADTETGDGTRYRGRRARVMSARLPVAGSHITSRSLYGTWRAEVFLDGNERRCTPRPEEFTIEP